MVYHKAWLSVARRQGAPHHAANSTRPGGGKIEGPLSPVPPTEVMAGAGAGRGRKDESRRRTTKNAAKLTKAPFSLDSKTVSFSGREKEMGFVVLAKSALFCFRLTAKTHSAPLLVLSRHDPLRWARTAERTGGTDSSAPPQNDEIKRRRRRPFSLTLPRPFGPSGPAVGPGGGPFPAR